jgi:hypothetical protein
VSEAYSDSHVMHEPQRVQCRRGPGSGPPGTPVSTATVMRSRGLGRRIHGSVEDTKLSTNKQHSLSDQCVRSLPSLNQLPGCGQRPRTLRLSLNTTFVCVAVNNQINGLAVDKATRMFGTLNRQTETQDHKQTCAHEASDVIFALARLVIYVTSRTFICTCVCV